MVLLLYRFVELPVATYYAMNRRIETIIRHRTRRLRRRFFLKLKHESLTMADVGPR